jgi:hypothetical protein
VETSTIIVLFGSAMVPNELYRSNYDYRYPPRVFSSSSRVRAFQRKRRRPSPKTKRGCRSWRRARGQQNATEKSKTTRTTPLPPLSLASHIIVNTTEPHHLTISSHQTHQRTQHLHNYSLFSPILPIPYTRCSCTCC